MSNHAGELHHLKRTTRIETERNIVSTHKKMDSLIYVVVFLGPIMNLPQLLKIWLEKEATGVSLISWISFTLFSLVWLIYGIVHQEKPIIFMNFALMLIQAFVAVGVYLYQ